MKNPSEIQAALRLVCQSNRLHHEFEVIGELCGQTVPVISVLEEKGVVSFATPVPNIPHRGKYCHSDDWENIRPKVAAVNGIPPKVFDALALLNVYFFADLAYPGVASKAEREKLLDTLHKAGYLTTVGDAESAASDVQELYNETLEAHVAETFPTGWEPTHDYWGAKCFSYQPGWNAPKTGTYFAGDTSCRYETFDSAEALWERTNEILTTLENDSEELELEHEP